MKTWLLIIAAYLIAVGTIWTAYESHIANIGVAHWASEFDQIRQQAAPDDAPPPDAVPTAEGQHSL